MLIANTDNQKSKGIKVAFNWICPHCSMAQSVVPAKSDEWTRKIALDDQDEGYFALQCLAIGCSNENCKRSSVVVVLGPATVSNSQWVMRRDVPAFFSQVIYPQGAAKPQPNYIPQALRDDYLEACLIRDLSPKAAATLVRRCLQGMIRDFCDIKRSRLVDEIDALRKAVDEHKAPAGVTLDSVDAIDAVRGIGNIGAHMEKDINVIVDVDPGEAQALIDLVEMLFSEWYVARHKRQERLAGIQAMAAEKKAELAAQKAAAAQIEDKSDPPPAP